MEMTTKIQKPEFSGLNSTYGKELLTPFGQKMVSITQQEYIELTSQVNYWKALHTKPRLK